MWVLNKTIVPGNKTSTVQVGKNVWLIYPCHAIQMANVIEIGEAPKI